MLADRNISTSNEEYISEFQAKHVGKRFRGASLHRVTFGESGTAEEVIKWIQKEKNFLVFLGAPGIGKTYFCSALIPWISDKIQYFRYFKERDFLSRIRESMNLEKSSYLETVKMMCDDNFMILDDLGSSGFNEWRKEVFFEAIDIRYESQLPTVFTSNLTKEQIFQGLGKRTYSRLFAKENLIIEMHEAEDLRQK